MNEVGSATCRRRTEELIDDLAHDAGLLPAEDHLKARAGVKSAEEARRTKQGGPGDAALHLVEEGARELGPEVVDHALFHGNGAAAVRVAAFASGPTLLGFLGAGSAVAGAYSLYKQAWAEAHAKGDDLRALAQNDAVNVALTRTLAFHPGFGDDESRRRPGVEKATTRLVETLRGQDARLVPILQARADAGFIAAERAFAATVPLAGDPERAGAIRQWLKDNGFEERLRTDIAFGKGVEYFTWLEGTGRFRGADLGAEASRVHDRLSPPQTFACQG